MCLFIDLNMKTSINFCARLYFNVIWFAKCMKVRKLKIEIMSIYIAQFIVDTMHCRVIKVILKAFYLELGAYSFAQFLYCN